MKKIVIIAIILSLFTIGGAFASNGWAVGGAFAFDFGIGSSLGGPALCLSVPNVPVMFGIRGNFQGDGFLGVTADWWLFKTNLVGPVKLYLGPGIYAAFAGGDPGNFYLGMRVPIGFQIYIVNAFEIFLEPAVEIEFLPQLPTFGLGASVGFRFWF